MAHELRYRLHYPADICLFCILCRQALRPRLKINGINSILSKLWTDTPLLYGCMSFLIHVLRASRGLLQAGPHLLFSLLISGIIHIVGLLLHPQLSLVKRQQALQWRGWRAIRWQHRASVSAPNTVILNCLISLLLKHCFIVAYWLHSSTFTTTKLKDLRVLLVVSTESRVYW